MNLHAPQSQATEQNNAADYIISKQATTKHRQALHVLCAQSTIGCSLTAVNEKAQIIK
jgi:hypothetical protein